MVDSQLVEVPDQGKMEDCIAEMRRIENTEELLLLVMAERDSLPFAVDDTKKQLQEVEPEFFCVTVEKKTLVEQVVKPKTEIHFLSAEVAEPWKTLEEHPVAQDKKKQWKGSQILSTVNMCYIGISLQNHTSLTARCPRKTLELDSFAQSTKRK